VRALFVGGGEKKATKVVEPQTRSCLPCSIRGGETAFSHFVPSEFPMNVLFCLFTSSSTEHYIAHSLSPFPKQNLPKDSVLPRVLASNMLGGRHAAISACQL
jgi:hypothetical protein